jgi:hypothetical protein
MEDVRKYGVEEVLRGDNENPVEWEAATEDDVPYHIPRD